MSHKIFVSYKYKDINVEPLYEYTPGEDTGYYYTPRHYVDKIIDTIGADNIYKGEKGGEDMSHLTDDTIDSKLKEKIFDSSITIVLISPNMFDRSRLESEQWIPNEIIYSLRNKTRGDKTSKTNAMLAVVLPDTNGSYEYGVIHKECGVTTWQTQTFFKIINKNMFNKSVKNQTFCSTCYSYHHHGQDHSYIHPVKWSQFIVDHNSYINHVLELREKMNEYDLTKEHK